MIAPTPPAANLHSQLMRVWVREPSSLSNRPALFDDGIDRGRGAPPRLAPQLAHAFEAAHEIVHGDTRGMNAGEIAMNEIGEQSTRSLQAAAEMEEDRSQRVTGVHGGVEHAGGSPTLPARLVVAGEQSPDRLLRGRSQRRSAARATHR